MARTSRNSHKEGDKAGVSSITDLDVIIDSDAHILETIGDLLPYMDSSPGIKKRISGCSNPYTSVYSRAAPTPPATDHYGDLSRGSEAEKTIEDMVDFDIDYSILNPGLNQGLPTVNNTRFAVAIAKAYNSWVVDNFVDEYEHIYPSILIPPQKPDKAAEEIDEYADETGVAGITFPVGGLVPPMGHHQYDIIYEAAEDSGLPIIMHGNSVSAMYSRPVQAEWTETFLENHVVVFPSQLMWNMTTLMFQGVPEKFPDLRFVAQEAGISWVPYLTWRFDDHYFEYPDDSPYLTRRPSTYLEDQFYFSTQPLGNTDGNPHHLAQIIDMIGPESVLYAADLPHFDFDPPDELFTPIKSHFSGEEIRGIMGETAAELFGIDT